MSEWALKRFWKAVAVEEAEGGFTVKLDGRGVRTPAKAPLAVPSRAFAEAVAAEWEQQVELVDPRSMPATRMANAAIDKVRHQRAEVARMLGDYGDSDLLCYRATQPDALVARQAAVWDPYLDWADAHLGARLVPVAGVMHAPQDANALKRLQAHVDSQTAFELAAFHDLVALTGSLVLGFATIHQIDEPETIWAASRLDEAWQIEQWGEDEEAAEVAEIKKADFLNAARFFELSRAT